MSNMLVRWDPLQSGVWKLKVDGTSRGLDQQAGGRGCLRTTELRLVLEGLKLAWDKRCRRLVAETNYLEMV